MASNRAQYGPNYDGLGDPDRITVAERQTESTTRLIEERNRRRSASPLVRALQAATDKALGRGGKR